jgi:hypothetical protein
MNIKQAVPALLAAATLLLAACASPPPPPRHPAYLHALSDLRAARWNLEHRPGDAAVSGQEDVAITEIDRAINEARRAAADDGMNTANRPPADAALNRAGRLHHAAEFLHKAKDDVAREEDNPETRPLRNAVVMHIDAAIRATDRAIRDVEMGR